METKGHLVCPACGKKYPEEAAVWQCTCGSCLDLAYTFTPCLAEFKEAFEPSPSAIVQQNGTTPATAPAPCGQSRFLRYRSVLPLNNPGEALGFSETATPLMDTTWEGRPVCLKLEYTLPTGSFKDRGAFLLINKCRELGIKSIVVDSSGNSACSAAAYSALAGIEAHIFMPAGNSSGKTRQVSAYGATLYKIPGSRLDTARAAEKATATHYYAAHTRNPYFLHGTKTAAYEIMEQLRWQLPEAIFIPVGSGSLLLGMYLGFTEMKNAGLIDRYPRLMAVQSDCCSPIDTVFNLMANAAPGTTISEADIAAALKQPPAGTVLAEGIANSHPPRLYQIAAAVQHTGGDVLLVTDQELVEALRTAAARGLYIEPTSATALAAIRHYKARGRLVVMLTGHGLKAGERIEKILEKA